MSVKERGKVMEINQTPISTNNENSTKLCEQFTLSWKKTLTYITPNNFIEIHPVHTIGKYSVLI
jgi:hypothetical protein